MVASDGDNGRDSADQPRLEQDRLVESLVPDPSRHEPKVCLTGLLGRGTADGMWRLYVTSGLDEFVEFGESDVVHTEPVPESLLPSGGTTVWLRAGATVRHTRISSQQVQAEFLQGSLTSTFMPRSGLVAPQGLAGENTGPGCTRNYVCSINPHIPACQVNTEHCGSPGCGPNTGAICPTGAFVC